MSNKVLEFLEFARRRYYEGTPIISDEQYDALEERYGEALKPGYALDRGVPHLFPMYSLKKYYDGEDKLPLVNNYDVVTSTKLDGAACALVYIDGIFSAAITRGDGEKGLEFTHLISQDKGKAMSIPWLICSPYKVVQITGEIVAPKTISNARNYAAGAVSLKSREEFLERELTFIAYDSYPAAAQTYREAMSNLNSLGFKTVLHGSLAEFPTDGWVIRVSDYLIYKELGFTSKYPRGAYALKQRTEGVKTQLLDVVWQTGKSGKVTPVAILDPIEIEGATVSRATLNNVGFIESLDLEIGDYVMVERSGGIIPRIICKATEN